MYKYINMTYLQTAIINKVMEKSEYLWNTFQTFDRPKQKQFISLVCVYNSL